MEFHADEVDFESVEELGERSLDPPGAARVEVVLGEEDGLDVGEDEGLLVGNAVGFALGLVVGEDEGLLVRDVFGDLESLADVVEVELDAGEAVFESAELR